MEFDCDASTWIHNLCVGHGEVHEGAKAAADRLCKGSRTAAQLTQPRDGGDIGGSISVLLSEQSFTLID